MGNVKVLGRKENYSDHSDRVLCLIVTSYIINTEQSPGLIALTVGENERGVGYPQKG